MIPSVTQGTAACNWAGLIPPDARVVLLVNCADNLVAARYRRRNPDAFVVGIESDTARLPASPRGLDRLILVPAGSAEGNPPGLSPGSADCLILGTPLNACASPLQMLSEASRLLASEGVILAVAGGIGFDAGHWQASMARVGLCLIDIEPINGHDLPFDDSPHRHEAGTTRATSRGGLVLLRGVRGGSSRRRLVIQTLAATPICSRVRTEEPDAALRTIPGVRTRTDYLYSPQLGGGSGVDRILIRQRNILGPTDLAGQRAMRMAGYLLVCEWDDDPAIFPEIVRSQHLTFRACHCVQTSTESLAEVLRAHHPHVRVFRNQVFELPPPRAGRSEWPVTIVFAALNREPDWPEIVPALGRVLDEMAGQVRLEVIHDRAFFDAVPGDAKDFRPFLPFDQYVEMLRRSDIALLPLASSRFNQCKSDLKYLECAANGVVCLASPTVYGSSIRHGETGMIYRSGAEFESMLRQLIADPLLRSSLAAAAYRDVARHRMLAHTFRERYRWYESMLRRLPELDRSLCDRVPELA